MRAALGLARRGLGRTWPNPAVGCVLARDGRIVGRGWTRPGGRPHAETEALAEAGPLAAGATAYVTLEPCDHHGMTPPCSRALVAAGVARVVVAIEDPDPRTDGGGIATLRAAGVDVTVGVEAEEAREVTGGFLMRVTCGRPLVTLKAATSLDGRIATASGESRWITSEPARAYGHLLRARHDAILVGIGTALADDPELTCRLAGLEDRSPVRVVIDGGLRLPPTSKLARSADSVPLWLICRDDAPADRRALLAAAGAEVLPVPADGAGGVDLDAALRALGARGLTRLLVEGGGRIAGALLRADLVDRIALLRAPMLIGGDGIAAIGMLGVDRIDRAIDLVRKSATAVGRDVLEHYAVAPRPPQDG